jgi:hypothetical protein
VDNNGDAGLERISDLEAQLSRAPVNSDQHRLLARAILLEAALYRKSLDDAQARNNSTRAARSGPFAARRTRRVQEPVA